MPGGHPQQGPVQGIHVIHHYEYPTVGDMNAGTNEVNSRAAPGATAIDIGRAGRVTATDDWYLWTGSLWKAIAVGTASMGTDLVAPAAEGSVFEAGGGFTVGNGLSYTTPVVPAGDYEILWYMEAKNDTLNSITRTRIQLDAADIAFADLSITVGATAEKPWGGRHRVTLTNAAHTVTFDFFPLIGTTAELRRRRLRIVGV